MESLPRDIVPLLQSCWGEDPKIRPEFKEITVSLTNFLHNFCSTETKLSKIVEIDYSKSHVKEDSIDAGHVTNKSNDKVKKQKTTFLCCFDDCLSD